MRAPRRPTLPVIRTTGNGVMSLGFTAWLVVFGPTAGVFTATSWVPVEVAPSASLTRRLTGYVPGRGKIRVAVEPTASSNWPSAFRSHSGGVGVPPGEL